MLKTILRFFLFLLIQSIKLPWKILFNSSYRDKALLYTWQKSAFELEGSTNLATSFSTSNVSFPATGGGMLGRRGRLIIEGSGTGGGSLQRQGEHLLAVGGGDGRLSAGLLPNKRTGLRIYPIVGIGGAGSSLKVQHDDGSTLLNSGLADFDYHVGVAFDLIIGWRIGILIGARIGLESPIAGKRMTPFLRLTGGVGWFGKEPIRKEATLEKVKPTSSTEDSPQQAEREPQLS